MKLWRCEGAGMEPSLTVGWWGQEEGREMEGGEGKGRKEGENEKETED